jgi:hypothetical protein
VKFEILNLDARIVVCVRPRAARKVAIYSQESGRPADLVVGPAGPTSWPNGLILLLIFLGFMVKQVECSFRWKCILDGAE